MYTKIYSLESKYIRMWIAECGTIKMKKRTMVITEMCAFE